MKKILVLQQRSTGIEIYRESTERSITGWEKITVRKMLRSVKKESFWQALKDGDYASSWYGKDYDKFVRKSSREVCNKVCKHAFKEYPEEMLTQEELFDILHKLSEAYKNVPLQVKTKRYYEKNR